MRLFIAEKPDLARAIVDGLGGGNRKEGYYDCGTDYVTWCFGHMLMLLDPEDYDARYSKWVMEDLPIVHMPWQKKPGTDKKQQLKIIIGLLKKADSVVHAGDPDEEGQLLVDEILSYANIQLPVKRLLINDNNKNVVQKALNNLRDNSEFKGMSIAAEARSVADQLYGYNMTRAYTLAARQAGYANVLSVGRVQTPILGMVVRRCRAFKAHQKAFYYNVTADFNMNSILFSGRYHIVDGDPVDEKNRLVNAQHAQAIAEHCKNKPAKIVSAKTTTKHQPPPLPYNLLKLQTDAARKFGLKPDKVKDITQSLREKHKLITYNRSDCEYLSEEQHSDAPGVLAAIAATATVFAPAIKHADAKRLSRAFNSSKISAHHAIIPTAATANFSTLSEAEQKIYQLIARAYIAQFWPNYSYDHTDMVVAVAGHQFNVRAHISLVQGWRALYKNDTDNENIKEEEDALAVDIRALQVAAEGSCVDAQSTKMETKPQPLYTMATLLTDLTRVAKYIQDERLRKLLQAKDKGKEGEHGGIGTPATRDSIINTLFQRNYLLEQNKTIIASSAGEEFYDALPDQAKYPDMTALWHEQQQAIRAGEGDIESFIRELMEYITKEIEGVKQNGLQLKIQAHACPQCSKALRRIKGSKGFFWGCSAYQEGCKYSCADKDNAPLFKVKLQVSELHKCMACGKGLSRHESKKKKAAFWWGCSGYPACKKTYFDNKGKPDYNTGTEKKAALCNTN
jgi:DNA topoisomerase-3